MNQNEDKSLSSSEIIFLEIMFFEFLVSCFTAQHNEFMFNPYWQFPKPFSKKTVGDQEDITETFVIKVIVILKFSYSEIEKNFLFN